MLKLTVGYQTGTGNSLTLDIFADCFHRDDVPLFYPKEDLIHLCGDCKGYSGGCPPYAPYFEDIKPSCPWFYVLVVRMDMAWAIAYSGDTDYFRFSYADRLTVYYLQRVSKAFSDLTKSYSLTAGGCSACHPCVVLDGKPCAHPRRRGYSVEATGVDCSELHRIIFGRRLPYWYYDGAIPRYMVRYGGFFVNTSTSMEAVMVQAVTQDKHFTLERKPVPQYRLVERVAPEHVVDAGMKYDAYEKENDSYEVAIHA